jgi:hypothetical protein
MSRGKAIRTRRLVPVPAYRPHPTTGSTQANGAATGPARDESGCQPLPPPASERLRPGRQGQQVLLGVEELIEEPAQGLGAGELGGVGLVIASSGEITRGFQGCQQYESCDWNSPCRSLDTPKRAKRLSYAKPIFLRHKKRLASEIETLF